MLSSPPRRRVSKKLLVASLGVAAVNYVGACNPQPPQPVGNLAAPMVDAGPVQPPVGNLMPPPPPPAIDAQAPRDIPPGNLMPPPPPPPPSATSKPTKK